MVKLEVRRGQVFCKIWRKDGATGLADSWLPWLRGSQK